jgi:hypothetical protein
MSARHLENHQDIPFKIENRTEDEIGVSSLAYSNALTA